MDFAYNEEQREIIRVVRDLVEKEIKPYALEMDETETPVSDTQLRAHETKLHLV